MDNLGGKESGVNIKFTPPVFPQYIDPRPATYAFEPSAGEPIGGLDEEDVAGPAEDHAGLPSGAEITFERQEVFPLLLPHEEERRSRTILPSHHGVAPQRVGAEVGIADRERRRRARSVGIDGIGLGRTSSWILDSGDGTAVVLPIAQIALGARGRELLEVPVPACRRK